MARKRVSVTNENESGRNERFHDNYANVDITRNQFVQKIKQGQYPNHHVRNINGVDTPVSNPDAIKDNNLD